jgi:hypothetical protein
VDFENFSDEKLFEYPLENALELHICPKQIGTVRNFTKILIALKL